MIKSKSPSIFLYVMILLTIVGAIIILFASTWLWDSLEKYERSTPENYIHHFINDIQRSNAAALMRRAGIEETDFFSTKDYNSYMKEKLGNDSSKIIISELGKMADGDKTLYELHLQDKNGIIIELAKDDNQQDGYSIKQQPPPLLDMKVIAPSNLTIFANDIQLTDKYKLQNNADKAKVLSLQNEEITLPVLQEYRISGFLKEPVITVKDVPESEYRLTKKDNTVTIVSVPPIDISKEIETLAVNAAKEYAKFVSNDGEFASYEKYVLVGTPYYKSLKNFDNSWYVAHSGYKFANMATENTMSYSEKCFSTDIYFDYIISKYGEDSVYPTKYRVYFLKIGNDYKIIEMEIK